MGKDGVVRGFAVAVVVLSHHGGYSHGHSDKAVVIYTNPDNVEPCQPALWRPPSTTIASAAFGKPGDGPHPWLDGRHVTKVVLLLVQVGGDIVAHERKEGGYGEGFVAVADDLVVDGVPVLPDAQEGRDGIDGDHEQNANDVFLLAGLGVVEGMHPYQVQTRHGCYDSTAAPDYDGQPVEGEAGHDLDFGTDCGWSASCLVVCPVVFLGVHLGAREAHAGQDGMIKACFGAKKLFGGAIRPHLYRAIDLPRSSSIVVLHVKFIFVVCRVVSTAFGPKFSSLLP